MSIGKTMLGRRHVLPSVVATLVELQVEGTFPSGTYLVTVHHPVSSDEGDLERALYGSFLPVPSREAFPDPDPEDYMPEKMPGAVIPAKHARIVLNDGRKRIRLKVMSKGDRPIQVCRGRCVVPGTAGLQCSTVQTPAWRDHGLTSTSISLGRIALPLHRDKSAIAL